MNPINHSSPRNGHSDSFHNSHTFEPPLSGISPSEPDSYSNSHSAFLQNGHTIEPPSPSYSNGSPSSAAKSARANDIFSIKAESYHSALLDTTLPSLRSRPTPSSLPSTLKPSRPVSPPLLSPPPLSDLPGISIRAHALGILSGAALVLTLNPTILPPFLHRLPFYILALSTFHLLEFQATALYNPFCAEPGAFLLGANGWAYNIAHLSAMSECILTNLLFPSTTPPTARPTSLQILGLIFMLLGQAFRTTAMAHAGSAFNHIVQTRRRASHKLVTTGVYAWSRHPAYAGFWWWAVGTQLWLGNWVCLVGFAVLLWAFFVDRVRREEEGLRRFFGDEYGEYRERVGVGIPLLR
ncbi:MAG: hypothetical protein M1814_006188 [Vezdaea aestivalis]|nr:MAG: hypothetical protein M1814_006188 [Vezdaea aestivalis]